MNNCHQKAIPTLALLFLCLPVFSQSLYSFKNDKGLYGFKSDKDKVKIKPQFEDAKKFSGKLCGVKSNGKWGYINGEGDVVIPYQYDAVDDMVVTLNGKKGLIDEKGKEVLPIQYAALRNAYPLFIASMDGKKFGFIDSSGKAIIPMVFDECRPFDNEVIIIKNKDGGYEWKNPNRLAAVKLNGSWGFIDKKNNFAVPPIYKDVKDYQVEYTWVSLDGQHYAGISRQNRMITQFVFTDVGSWDKTGKSSAQWGSEHGVITYQNVFTGDKNSYPPRQLQTYRFNSDAAEEMIKSGLKAKAGGSAKEAVQWFTKAYSNGSGEAARILGFYYLLEDTLQKGNRARAVEWFQKGVAAADLVCMSEIANMYIGGKDLPQNDTLAFNMLKQIGAYLNGYDLEMDFDDDDYDAILASLLDLGDFYHYGQTTPVDETQAFYWYKKAAEAGSEYGNLLVAEYYYNGVGVEKNLSKAYDSYLSAADYYDEAVYYVGIMLYNGEGVKKNKEEGIKWLKIAANNKHKKSQDFLKQAGIKP